MVRIDLSKEIMLSKHFRNTWLRKWDWDINDLRTGLREAYHVEKMGKNKYEACTRHKTSGKSRKIVFVLVNDRIYIITGAEGS